MIPLHVKMSHRRRHEARRNTSAFIFEQLLGSFDVTFPRLDYATNDHRSNAPY